LLTIDFPLEVLQGYETLAKAGGSLKGDIPNLEDHVYTGQGG